MRRWVAEPRDPAPRPPIRSDGVTLEDLPVYPSKPLESSHSLRLLAPSLKRVRFYVRSRRAPLSPGLYVVLSAERARFRDNVFPGILPAPANAPSVGNGTTPGAPGQDGATGSAEFPCRPTGPCRRPVASRRACLRARMPTDRGHGGWHADHMQRRHLIRPMRRWASVVLVRFLR